MGTGASQKPLHDQDLNSRVVVARVVGSGVVVACLVPVVGMVTGGFTGIIGPLLEAALEPMIAVGVGLAGQAGSITAGVGGGCVAFLAGICQWSQLLEMLMCLCMCVCACQNLVPYLHPPYILEVWHPWHTHTHTHTHSHSCTSAHTVCKHKAKCACMLHSFIHMSNVWIYISSHLHHLALKHFTPAMTTGTIDILCHRES